VRRNYVWTSRKFFYAQLFLARIYLTWTRSPTWNFVAIAGSLGVALTILLFLSPRELKSDAAQRRRPEAKSRPTWDLDSRLVAAKNRRSQDYAVEIAFTDRPARTSGARLAETTSHRRRNPRDDRPLEPLLAPEPAPEAARRPATEPDLNWFDDEPPRKGVRIEFELEIVRRPAREGRDVTFTARTESPHVESDPFDENRDEDAWRPFDSSRVADHREDAADGHRTVGGLIDDEPPSSGTVLPAVAPETAPGIVDIALKWQWERVRRRRRGAALTVANIGADPIPRIELHRGRLTDDDLAGSPPPARQALSDISPGDSHPVALRVGSSLGEVISAVVTAYVGHETIVSSPVAPEKDVAPRMRRRERPHLTMTTGAVERLRRHHLISVPIHVVNDGDTALDEVVIVAELPATLRHRYGQTVHYRIGGLRPQQDHRTIILLIPLEPGESAVTFSVADKAGNASDERMVTIGVSSEDVTTPERTSAAREAGDDRWTRTRRATP
jgi:hypothetical protein